jgi:hypothetical protein
MPARSRGRRRSAQPPLWRPETLGEIIAQRELTFRRGKVEACAFVTFGHPLRAPASRDRDSDHDHDKDPWWTPLKIEGLHKPLFTCIAGEDAVQALVLAFRFAESILPDLARRAGGEVEWLGERSRLILGPVPVPARANGRAKPRAKPRKRA